MIERSVLEAHKGSGLDEHEVRFQKHLKMAWHRPAGVPESQPVLTCFAAVRASADKLDVAFPQEEVDRLIGGENRVTDASLGDILMRKKTLTNGDVAFPLIAAESLGGVKTRVRAVRASDVARWMPPLGAIAGITDADLLTKAEYEAL